MSNYLDFKIDESNETATFALYDKFTIVISAEDWEFLCKKRWLTDAPTRHEVEVEFGVCGARGAVDNEEANRIVKKTIEALRGFVEKDVVAECKKHVDGSKRIVGHMDKNGRITFSEHKEF